MATTTHPDIDFCNRLGVPVDIHLVACGATKASTRSKARDLYTGSTTRRGIAYSSTRASITGDGPALCLIVSALYGLVDLDAEIDPYDVTLAEFGPEQHAIWAELVKAQLREMGIVKANVHVHGGQRYMKALRAAFETYPTRVKIVDFFNPWAIKDRAANGIGARRGFYKRTAEREVAR